MPGVPVYSLLLVCVLPIQSAREAAGAAGTRHSPRPPRGRKIQQRLGRNAPRDRETVFDEYQRATLSAVVARHWARRKRDPVTGMRFLTEQASRSFPDFACVIRPFEVPRYFFASSIGSTF